MANEVYKFMTAVKGYHYYKTYWNPVCNQTLFNVHMKLKTLLICSILKCVKTMEKLWIFAHGNFANHKILIGPRFYIDRTFDINIL